MLRLRTGIVSAALLALSLPAPAVAESLVICHVGGPGTTAQAVPALDKFLRHVEQAAGLARGSMSGEYHTTMRGCLAYVAKHKPVFGVFDLPTYLRQHKRWKIKPLAHMGQANSQRYHLLVRDGSFADLAALKGKKLISTVADLKFVSKMIFGGKLDAAAHFKVKTTRKPLKGIRKVARGRADATLVDALALKHLPQLKLPVKLKAIHSSGGLPGLTMAVLQVHSASAGKLVRKLTAVLPKLCAGDGKRLCESFSIKAFRSARAATYNSLVKQYGP